MTPTRSPRSTLRLTRSVSRLTALEIARDHGHTAAAERLQQQNLADAALTSTAAADGAPRARPDLSLVVVGG